MLRAMKTLLAGGLALSLTAAFPAPAAEEHVDYLALAALMLRDGNLDRALTALDQVETAAEGTDLARYYTLRGMTHVRRNEHLLARGALEQAVAAGATDAVVHVYLAQSRFHLEDYQGTLAALDAAGPAIDRIPSIYHMRAQCHWLLDDPVMAIATLDQAGGLFPDDPTFLRRKVFFLVDLGLFRQAVVLGREYLQRSEGRLEDFVAFGNALRASGEMIEAALLLEQAQLQFPDAVEVRKVLARVYIDRGQLGAAADVLYQAALLEPALLAEAAELYRRSGQAWRALMLNSQLSDQPEKFRQRLALYLQIGNFEQAAAMETPLRRAGLLDDQDIRYAVAYALFKTGDFDAAEGHLAHLDRPDLFRKAAELRRVIGDCGAERWKCL